MKNRGASYLRSKEERMAWELEGRIRAKEIRQYVDEKSGVVVRVFEGCGEGNRFRTIPTGYSE